MDDNVTRNMQLGWTDGMDLLEWDELEASGYICGGDDAVPACGR